MEVYFYKEIRSFCEGMRNGIMVIVLYIFFIIWNTQLYHTNFCDKFNTILHKVKYFQQFFFNKFSECEWNRGSWMQNVRI